MRKLSIMLLLLFLTKSIWAQTGDGTSFITKWKTNNNDESITILIRSYYNYDHKIIGGREWV